MSHGNKQQWILAKRPEGMPDSSEVILQDAPIPETGPGMLLVKNHYISLDPAIRGWMSDIPNYLPPIPCLLYTSPSPRDVEESRMPSSA